MDCARIDLIAYHLDLDEPEERDRSERHLVACTACLEDYLALKRCAGSLGLGPPGGASGPEGSPLDRPSPELRARLRRDVARAFVPRGPSRVLGWLVRPIPLYQGLAATAAVVLAAVIASGALKAPFPVPSAELERIDTARPAAESLSIY